MKRSTIASEPCIVVIPRRPMDARKVAVERNLEIAPRSTYADTALADGDRIEIVTFIGGG